MGNRSVLRAQLSVADLARVRQALALLSDEPATAAVSAAAPTDGSVPSSVLAGEQAAGRGGDEADTNPLPVILPGATTAPRTEPVPASRGPFEPARPSKPSNLAEPEPPAAEPAPIEPADSLPAAAAAKLDQIKDLLLTAEAIGEQNLDMHFEQVSQRQRELIREFFQEAAPGRDGQT